MAWGALIGAGVSLLGGLSQRKEAKRQAKAQQAAEAQRMAMLQQNADFARGEYDRWNSRFDPVYDELSAMADDDSVDYSGVMGDATAAFDASEGARQRQAARYGQNPADGAWGAAASGAGLSRAMSVVDAMNRQRMDNKDKRWERYGALANLSQSGMSNATGMVSNAFGSMAGAFGDQAANAGANARESRAGAASAFGAAGQIIGGIDWGSALNKTLPPTSGVERQRFSTSGLSGINDIRTNIRPPGG